jgi:hypothetical protein
MRALPRDIMVTNTLSLINFVSELPLPKYTGPLLMTRRKAQVQVTVAGIGGTSLGHQ